MLHSKVKSIKRCAWVFAILSAFVLFQGVLGCTTEFVPKSDASASTDSDTGRHVDTGKDTGTATGTGEDTSVDSGRDTTTPGMDTGTGDDTHSLTDADSTTAADTHVDTAEDTHGDTAGDTGSQSAGSSDLDTGADTDTGCPAGYQGADCSEACDSTKLDIGSCTNSLFDCSLWIDGDNSNSSTWECTDGQQDCLPVSYDFDLRGRFFVKRFRFLSDWWNKRPSSWDLLASDNGVNYSLVVSGVSNHSPWRCVDGEPCTVSVPLECCPDGVYQDTSSVGTNYPKWDDFRFTGVVARYWRFRVNATYDPQYFSMRELELYGNGCLGSRCEVLTCAPGVCTETGPAYCTCVACGPAASCTSAFVGDAPGCSTAEP